MWWLILIPFFLQASVILLDEFLFHIHRGLPLWERIGHPLDTLSVLVCMFYVLWVPFSPGTLKLYIALAILSSLLVTKDEFVHKEHCPWKEQWLHALLFTLHPITLIAAGLIWPIVQHVPLSSWIMNWLNQPQFLHYFLYIQAGGMTLFLFYQIIFWNFVWTKAHDQQ